MNAKSYRLVISDLGMPSMNGFEFIKKVKEIKPERHL
jgi:YesN/AraC family two-component response regulator